MNDTFCEHEWIELEPRDLMFEGSHFLFLLENQRKEIVFPVRFSSESAELLGTAHIHSLWKSSLRFCIDEFMNDLGIRLQRCVFIKCLKGNHKVRVFYRVNGEEQYFDKDLGAVLGLCLEAEIPFYAAKQYIQNAKHSASDNEIFLQKQQWTDPDQKYLM